MVNLEAYDGLDIRFLNVDEVLRRAEAPYARARLWLYSGQCAAIDPEYLQERKDWSQNRLPRMEDLEFIKNFDLRSASPPVARLMQRYQNEYDLGEPTAELHETYRTTYRWQQLSANLKSSILPIQGPEAFQTAIRREKDESTRKQLYLEKQTNSYDFANSFLELRDARHKYALAKGFTNFYEMMLSERFGLTPEQIDATLNRLEDACSPWIKILEDKMKDFTQTIPVPAYNYNYYWTEILKSSYPEFQKLDYQQVITSLENFLRKVGLFSEYQTIWIDDEPRQAKSMPGYIGSENLLRAGISGYVIYDWSLITVKNVVDIIHEIFHGLHSAAMDQRLPYILRKQLIGDEVLSEMPPLLSEELIFNILYPDAAPEDFIDQYKRAEMMTKMTRWTSTIAILRLEKFIYENPQTSVADINTEYLQIQKKLHPNLEAVPPGVYEWANNMYYWYYPVYTFGHLLGGLFAAEVQAAGIEKFGSISSPEFFKWFKNKFLDPGFSLDWQSLYKKVLKKPFDPKHFFNKSEKELAKLKAI